MRTSALAILALVGTALGSQGCGLGNSLSTGSVTGGASQVQAPKPVTPSDRALHVGATLARAQRCGFYFDPEQLRANYLAAEQQAGTPPDLMQRATKELDYTRQSILTAIAKDEAYCTEGRTREVKAALGRQLAGDFNPPQARREVNVGLFDHQANRGGEFKGEDVFDKASRPRRTSDD